MGNVGKWFQLAFFLALAVSPYIYLTWRMSRLEREMKALRRWQPKEDSPRLSLYHRQKLRDAARSLEAFIGKTVDTKEECAIKGYNPPPRDRVRPQTPPPPPPPPPPKR